MTARRRQRSQFDLRGRLWLVGIALALSSMTLIGRAAYIQLIHSDFYQRQGQARYLRDLPIATTRGMITDRNGEPLAVSTPVASIWVNPQELVHHMARVTELATVLEMPAELLTEKIKQKSDKEFLFIKRRQNPDLAQLVLAKNIPGVFVQREFRRFYPQGEAMAHVLGFTNVDDRGQEGLELAFDHWLRGQPGSRRVVRDATGAIVESVDIVHPAVPGKDITLSLDRRIQFLAFKELREALRENQASSGSVVVLDVATGEILGMANLPSYNPNAISGVDASARRNRAVTDLIEPGSTMKPITISAALAAGVVQPTTQIDTNPGYLSLGRFIIRDTPRNNGLLDVTGVITHSSNIGAAKIANLLSDQSFYQSIHQFGYGALPDSEFPGEATGTVYPPKRWSKTTKTTMSYGYGLSVTALQIAQAFAAIGNGGVFRRPTFIKGQQTPSRRVISPDIARQVIQMMETVVTQGGAKQAAILGYHVAGKTGTARMIGAMGYEAKRYNALFVGLVPANQPRFATVVVINDPQAGHYYGGLVSAPVFHRIMEGALRLMDVPPDDLQSWFAAIAAEKNHVTAPNRLDSDLNSIASPLDEVAAGIPTVSPASSAKQGHQ